MTGKSAQGLKLKVDAGLYPAEAVQAAAYTLTDRVFVRMARQGAKEISVELKPKTAGQDLTALSDEFHNELLHEALRFKVSQANRKIREYIVTKALVSAQVPSEAPPVEAPVTEENCPECQAEAKARQPAPAPPVDKELEKEIEKLLGEIEKSGPADEDPLGVAVPWEKKYGAKGRAVPEGQESSAPGKGGRKAKAAPQPAPPAGREKRPAKTAAAKAPDAGLDKLDKLLAAPAPAARKSVRPAPKGKGKKKAS